MSWSHDYWPRDQHEYLLELVRADHGGVLPDWAIAADLVYLSDLAQHPRHPQPRPGRRELEKRWGTSERVTKAAIADVAWRCKAELAKVRVVDRERPRPRPASVPAASPPPAPPPTVEPAESAADVPAPVPAPVPPASPPPSPTRARSSFGPTGPAVPGGEQPSPFTERGLAVREGASPLEVAAVEVVQRLLDAGVAPPSAWRTTPRASQGLAQRAVVTELVQRAAAIQATPAELHAAATAYEGQWWPRAAQLVALVRAARDRERAETAARQLDLDELAVVLPATGRPVEVGDVAEAPRQAEAPRVVGLAALHAARQRRSTS